MIDYWFPTGIYNSIYHDHVRVKSLLLAHADIKPRNKKNYVCTNGWPYWSKMHNDIKDPFSMKKPTLDKLKIWIENQINLFAKSFNSESLYRIEQSWLNVLDHGDFQETHFHLGFDFSAVYFVSIPENSGRLIFENPTLHTNQRPIKAEIETELNSTSVIYKPIEGQLIAFRSNLRHGVLPHSNTEPRISIAVNLISKNEN